MSQDSKPSFSNPNLNFSLEQKIQPGEIGITTIDAANKVEKLIYNDQLTGFENRKGLNRHKENLKPEQYPLTMLNVDLDNVKKVNDNPDPNIGGHTGGDKYICSFVKFINEIFPDIKKFRLGGDEFLIPVSNLDPKKTESLYEKLEAFNEREQNPNRLQFTFETAVAHSDKDFYDALKKSDDKLVEAKKIKKSSSQP